MLKIPTLLLVTLLPLALQANQHRGVWFWNSSSSPYGSANIVGNNALENQTITFLKSQHIKRIYGSYKDRSIDEPEVIASWNEKLHQANIASQFLYSEPTWVKPANRPNLLAKITSRVINFNQAPDRTNAEKFKAIHLDLEPQQLSEWDTGTPADKRALLTDLLNTYTEVRTHLDNAGETTTKIYADFPVWYEKLPIDGGSVGWADATDRDNWFAAVGIPLDGISLMAFERDNFTSIDNAVTYERANIPGATIRTAVQAKVGPTETWPNIADFNNIITTLETTYTSSQASDIENYRLWREALDAQPITSVSVELQHAAASYHLDFKPTPDHTHIILHSSNLCQWKEVHRIISTDDIRQNYTIPTSDPTAFYKIYRFPTEPN